MKSIDAIAEEVRQLRCALQASDRTPAGESLLQLTVLIESLVHHVERANQARRREALPVQFIGTVIKEKPVRPRRRK